MSSWFKSVPPTKVTTKAVSWLPPAAGWYKLNTDASVRDTYASGDGVLRDHSGKVVFAFYKEFGELDVLAAEAAALEHGLQLCGSRGYLPLIIEVDSKIRVQLINAIGRAKWPLCNVLDRIRHCMLQLSASITHIFSQFGGRFFIIFSFTIDISSRVAIVVGTLQECISGEAIHEGVATINCLAWIEG